jgi:hypothetical protein
MGKSGDRAEVRAGPLSIATGHEIKYEYRFSRLKFPSKIPPAGVFPFGNLFPVKDRQRGFTMILLIY